MIRAIGDAGVVDGDNWYLSEEGILYTCELGLKLLGVSQCLI